MAGNQYRPIADFWILARAKLKNERKLYGAYPGGFLERARALLGCSMDEAVLHVCSGMVRHYPYRRGFGPNDKTLDLDPEGEPDFLQDARDPFPFYKDGDQEFCWKAILIDPPYSEADAVHYRVGAEVFPKPGLLLKNAFDVLPVGGRVGILHYVVPTPPPNAAFVACIAVMVGFNNRLRAYSVFEKLAGQEVTSEVTSEVEEDEAV